MVDWWWILISVLITFIVATFLGYYITRRMVQSELKKNPPISEKQIRAMFASMGQKPSETKVRQVLNSMKNADKK